MKPHVIRCTCTSEKITYYYSDNSISCFIYPKTKEEIPWYKYYSPKQQKLIREAIYCEIPDSIDLDTKMSIESLNMRVRSLANIEKQIRLVNNAELGTIIKTLKKLFPRSKAIKFINQYPGKISHYNHWVDDMKLSQSGINPEEFVNKLIELKIFPENFNLL